MFNNLFFELNKIKLKDASFSEEYEWVYGKNEYIGTISDFIRFLESYGECYYSIIDKYSDLLSDWSGITTVFIFNCADCNKLEYTTLNTINRRKGLICKKCFSDRIAIASKVLYWMQDQISKNFIVGKILNL